MHIPIINNFFLLVAKLEMLFIRKLNLPFGNSILIIVQNSLYNIFKSIQ